MPTVPYGRWEGAEYHRWQTSREADDELPGVGKVQRISIGGTEEIGFYLKFRGEPGEIAKTLEMAAKLARAVADGKATYKDLR